MVSRINLWRINSTLYLKQTSFTNRMERFYVIDNIESIFNICALG